MPEMDTNTTPEERFTRIENFPNTIAEDQSLHEEQLAAMAVRNDQDIRDLRNQVQALVSTTGDLAGVSRHLVTVQGELGEFNSLLRQLVQSHAKRRDKIEGQGLN